MSSACVVCKCASASFQIGERTTNIGYDTKAAVAKAKSDTNKGVGIKRRFVSEPASLRHKTICLSRVGWLSNVSLFLDDGSNHWFCVQLGLATTQMDVLWGTFDLCQKSLVRSVVLCPTRPQYDTNGKAESPNPTQTARPRAPIRHKRQGREPQSNESPNPTQTARPRAPIRHKRHG